MKNNQPHFHYLINFFLSIIYMDNDKRRVVWRDQLIQENPEVPIYLIETMIDTYLMAPEDTEKIIYRHLGDENKNVVN